MSTARNTAVRWDNAACDSDPDAGQAGDIAAGALVGANDAGADDNDKAGRRPIRVLLCEDNQGDYILLKQHLHQIEGRHFEIDWARTVEEAFTELRRFAHDVALIDYRLIGGTGLDILREAAALDWAAPSIMLTSLNDPSVDVSAMKLGAVDFICKDDLRPSLLERSIRYNIERKRLEGSLAKTNQELVESLVNLRDAKAKIEGQNQRIVSLAYHLASASFGESHAEWTGISVVSSPEANEDDVLGIWHFCDDGRTLLANDVMLKLFELNAPDDLQGRPIEALLSQDSSQRLVEALRGLTSQAAVTIEVEVLGQVSGCRSWAVMSLLPPAPDSGGQIHMATVVDITSRRKIENATHYLAKHDSLTGVANRASFYERLGHATAIARRNGSLVGLICVDLDYFKEVNDTYGHQAGDCLLRQVAERLKLLMRESDTVARLGGDEFGIIATNLRHREDAKIVAQKVSAVFAELYELRDHTIRSSASVGFSVFPVDGEDLEELFELADSALYQTKRKRAEPYAG